jgi:pyruvate/2-oxoacid:ferredoxin oxidoreductase alpha subunit
MTKELIKGNEAIVKGAILAGCRAYFGYPITPASEIAEAAAYYFPQVGGVFLQAESEVASINMVYGSSSAGLRCMTGSSGPGVSLMQEGISYLAGSELPCVIADIMRGGPGLGNIGPEQSDYNQMVKGGGHGNYRNIVLAPNCAQEMCDLTMLAFDLSDKYRNPAIVLADGYIGQMMEPVDFPEKAIEAPVKDWAVRGDAATRKNLLSSIYLSHEKLEQHNQKLDAKYRQMEENEVRYEAYQTDDAEIILVGYGIVSRVLRSAVEMARHYGIRAGLLRPITLYPFPTDKLAELSLRTERFLTVELSNGQMVDDVRLAIIHGHACPKRNPCDFYGRMGGMVPTTEEIFEVIKSRMTHPVECNDALAVPMGMHAV